MPTMTKKKTSRSKVSKESSKKNQSSIIDFIKNNITKPEEKNLTIVVKKLWGNFYRVNFVKSEYLTEDSVISNNRILDSRFIEIINIETNAKIIDKTISSNMIKF